MDDFLRNSEDRRFGLKKVVEKATNKLIEHVSGESIQVEQFPNDFELGVKVFIARAEVENSVKFAHMFDQLVRRFLNNLFEPKPPVLTVPKKIVYFCLPFTGSHSLQIRTQITRLCSAAYPHLNIRFVFRSSTRISSFFPFKDRIPTFLSCTYSSVDAVPHRMWVKPLAIYTPEYLNTWASLLLQENHHPAQSCPAYSPT